jgi:hypothetical protein
VSVRLSQSFGIAMLLLLFAVSRSTFESSAQRLAFSMFSESHQPLGTKKMKQRSAVHQDVKADANEHKWHNRMTISGEPCYHDWVRA